MPCPCSQFSQKPRQTSSGPKPLPKTKVNPVGAADLCGPLVGGCGMCCKVVPRGRIRAAGVCGKPVLGLSHASEQARRGRRPLRPASLGAVGCVVKWYRAAGFGPQGSAAPTNMTQVDQVLASD